jgi:aminomethyltransferase
VQGPTSGALLQRVADADVKGLKYFRVTSGIIGGVPVDISRTGYTGDLGYEVWMAWDQATRVWDALVAEGARFDLRPAGMLALDVARIEAGLLLIEVDFFSSRKALIPAQQYSPFEMGLGRLVQLEKGTFVGQPALRKEHARGAARQVVGLTINWEEVEELYETLQLPPQVPATASRVAVPVYRDGKQVGKATSTTWSPVLKKMIALATVTKGSMQAGTRLEMEVTVEAVRHRVGATVTPTPFFNPPRKTAPLASTAVMHGRSADL